MISRRISLNSSLLPLPLRMPGFLYLLNMDLRFSCSFLISTVTFMLLYLLPIQSAKRLARAVPIVRQCGDSCPWVSSGTHPVLFPPARGHSHTTPAACR